MTAERKGTLKRDAALQTLQICLWGILALLLALLITLELVSELGGEDIRVSEKITVASSSLSPMNAEHKVYSNHVTGRIANRSAKGVTVETMKVTVQTLDGAERVISLDAFVIPARSTYIVDKSFESGAPFERVVRVELTMDGEGLTLVNIAENERTIFSGATLLYTAFLVPAVWLLVRASKKRYYIFQESKMMG